MFEYDPNDKILNKINKTKEMLIVFFFFREDFYFFGVRDRLFFVFFVFLLVGDRNVKQRSWG